MTPAELDNRLRAAQAVIREAGTVAAGYFDRRAGLTIDHKGAQDLVSEADRACEDVIVSGLSRSFPGDAFLGEEGGLRNPGSATVWVIDPIDGTHNFLTGVPFWCISLALTVEGESALGVIYDPLSEELFSARTGSGAFVNGVRMEVSGAADLKQARVCVGFSYRRAVADHVRAIQALLDAGCEYLRLGSGALGLAYTAAGRFDAYWELHTNSWDAAAGICLVREAGGWTNDFLAGDGLMQGNAVLGATPALADELRRLTQLG